MATTTAQIKFSAGESPSVDELAGGVPAQVNVLVDAAGAVRTRPGISAWSEFPSVIPNASPVIGMSAWSSNSGGAYLVYVCEDRTIWALISTGLVVALSDATATTKLDGGLRPVFTSTRTRIVITGGGAPQKWEGTGLSARLGGSPPSFSHIVTTDQRLVGNDSGVSGIIYWSDIGDAGGGHESWPTGYNFREAEAKADPAIGLYLNAGELVVLGTETIQMLSPDPSQTFTTARVIDIGWGAPLTYVQFDDGFFGMDARSRAVTCDGRSLNVVSSPYIGEQLEDIEDPSDGWGLRYSFGNYNLGLMTFPTDGRSFVYDTGTSLWVEWHGYNDTTGALDAWSPTSGYFWAKRRVTLVGLPSGQIAVLDKDATTDLGDPILVQMTSTFEDHGTSRLKQCKHVRLRFHRGGDSAGTAVALYSYRDDAGGTWSQPFRFAIGDSSDAESVKTLDSPGTFRQRQHRITVDGAAFRFAGMEVDVEVLGN